MKWLSIGAHGILIFLMPKPSKHSNPLVRETLLNKYIKTPLKVCEKNIKHDIRNTTFVLQN